MSKRLESAVTAFLWLKAFTAAAAVELEEMAATARETGHEKVANRLLEGQEELVRMMHLEEAMESYRENCIKPDTPITGRLLSLLRSMVHTHLDVWLHLADDLIEEGIGERCGDEYILPNTSELKMLLGTLEELRESGPMAQA